MQAQDRLIEIKRKLQDTSAIANKVADEVVLGSQGLLARNYRSSGLKVRSGQLYRGIVFRNQKGNYVRVEGSGTNARLVVGVSYQAIPYARYALEGRGPVVARRAKALRFVVDGKVIFAKRVGPSQPHRVYFAEPADLQKVQEVVKREILG